MDHNFVLIKRATSEDTILSHLIPYIMHGWPGEKSELHFDLTAYWKFISELVAVDGVICNGNKVLIWSVMRTRLVEKIHSSHLGVENSIRNASDRLFWPSIRADIKAACENFLVCAQYVVNTRMSQILSHPVPDLPWQYISQDILKHNSRHYLITLDHNTAIS